MVTKQEPNVEKDVIEVPNMEWAMNMKPAISNIKMTVNWSSPEDMKTTVSPNCESFELIRVYPIKMETMKMQLIPHKMK